MRCKIICVAACAAAILLTSAHVENAKAQSATVCDAYARDYAKNNSRRGQVLGGGAVGGIFGAGIGAIFGGPAVGAAIGGTLGVVGGGRTRREAANQMYNAAYQDCMAGRVR